MVSRLLALCALALAATGLPARLPAQAPDTATHSAGASVAVARLVAGIQLDGILDEAAWAEGTPAAPLTQRDPDEGAAPSEATEIRVLLGQDALYVGVRLLDHDPAHIRALLTRRDATSESDRFTVELDSRYDRRTAFVFEVNPRGVRRDGMLQPDGTVDYSPDPVWEAGCKARHTDFPGGRLPAALAPV